MRLRELPRLLRDSIVGTNEVFTEGPMNRAIIPVAIPMMLEMLMESVFAIVDIFFVAKLGADAIATPSVTEAGITLLYAVAIGLSIAVTAVVARRIGEQDSEGAAVVAGQALWIGGIASIVISVVGVTLAEPLLRAMGASNAAISQRAGYNYVMFGGYGSMLFLFLLNGVFRGAGDASIAMRALWFANAINIVLDPCLILGIGPFPELGLEGAAVATTIGRSCGVALQFYYMFGRRTRVQLPPKHLRPRFKKMFDLVRVSIGGIMQFFIATSSWVF